MKSTFDSATRMSPGIDANSGGNSGFVPLSTLWLIPAMTASGTLSGPCVIAPRRKPDPRPASVVPEGDGVADQRLAPVVRRADDGDRWNLRPGKAEPRRHRTALRYDAMRPQRGAG